jgi:nicotinamidase/pyrazinamidase
MYHSFSKKPREYLSVAPISPSSQTALIVVDVQNDFCPGGALPVPKGDEVVDVLNRYIERFETAGAPVVATRDWHPVHHCSFQPQGGTWPIHCVQNTPGAQFHSRLALPKAVLIVSKGSDPQTEAYSGFQGTNLKNILKKWDVRSVWVGGLATDYCVKSTVLDAIQAGFETVFLEDASRGVDVKPGDGRRAEEEMIKAGAKKIHLKEVAGRS